MQLLLRGNLRFKMESYVPLVILLIILVANDRVKGEGEISEAPSTTTVDNSKPKDESSTESVTVKKEENLQVEDHQVTLDPILKEELEKYGTDLFKMIPINMFEVVPVNLSIFEQIQEFERLEEQKPAADPTPTETVVCHKPKFFTDYHCGEPEGVKAQVDIHDMIVVNTAKMPFNLDQWIHVGFIPAAWTQAKDKYLKFKHASVQLSDTKNRVIGRVAERIPCYRNQDVLFEWNSEAGGDMSELYENPGVKNMSIIECEGTNFNFNPTTIVLNFDPPVPAFYVNFKFTLEEINYLQNQKATERLSITTLLVDTDDVCYLHVVDQLDGLPGLTNMSQFEPEVPIKCHAGGPAFADKEGFFLAHRMNHNSTADIKHITFRGDQGPRPKSRMVFIAKPEWRRKVDKYNMKKYGIDPLGYLPGERVTEKREKITKVSAMRRPYLPLIQAQPESVDQYLHEIKFEPDDEKCEDSLRHKKVENVGEELARLYFDCDYSAHCMSEPRDCTSRRNCEYIVSWSKKGDYVQFKMSAYAVKFGAIAISQNNKLGNDSVTECVREENDTVVGYTSWNYEDESDGIIYTQRRRSCVPMEEFKGAMVDKYTLYCAWKRPIKTHVKGIEFDLDNKYYVIMSGGYESSHGVVGNIGKNNFVKVSKDPVNLNQYIGKNPFQQWVSHLHGLLMIVIWMLVMPISTFVVRYLKGTFVKLRILRKYSFWFGVHFISNTATAGVTLFSVIFMLATNNHWYFDYGQRLLTWHSMIGFVVSLLLVCQLCLAYGMLRYKGRWKHKVNFKLYHGVMGHITTYTGYGCVFASRYVREGFHCDSKSQLMWFTICYAVFHAIMSYQVCYSDFVRGRETARIYKIFLVDHHQTARDSDEVAPELEQLPEKDEPGSPCRKVVFISFLVVFVGFNIYFMFLMWHPASRDCLTVEALKYEVKQNDKILENEENETK